jgi:hypothetical protein
MTPAIIGVMLTTSAMSDARLACVKIRTHTSDCEVGSWKLEVGSRKSEVGRRNGTFIEA